MLTLSALFLLQIIIHRRLVGNSIFRVIFPYTFLWLSVSALVFSSHQSTRQCSARVDGDIFIRRRLCKFVRVLEGAGEFSLARKVRRQARSTESLAPSLRVFR